MAVEVQMPNFGLSIAEGTIEKWLKNEGDPVEKGDLLVVILTEKVSVEIPAEASGTLLKILWPAGAKVKIGETIALIGSPGEGTEFTSVSAAGNSFSPKIPQPLLKHRERGDLKISPLASRIASEHGVDMKEVAAQYPGKKIGKEEVLEFLKMREEKGARKAAKPAPLYPAEGAQDEEIRPLSGPLKAMADHMALSATVAARVTTMAEVDVTDLVKLRNALKEKFQKSYGVHLTYIPFIMRAMFEGIKEFPVLNASLRGEEVVIYRKINIGLAVDAGETLLVPVIKDVANKSLVDLAREIGQISAKAREGKLSLTDIQGGTITLTNAGVYGALLATPIIHQPQSAILWMGKFTETPVVRKGQVVIRSILYLCLSYDHRIIMGAQAVRFLQKVKDNLESPYLLLIS